MLGGYGDTSAIELEFSRDFIRRNMEVLKKGKRAFDVGAGIGRITKELLLDFFEEVDLLD